MDVKYYIGMAWKRDEMMAQDFDWYPRAIPAIYIIRYLHDDPHSYDKIYWQGRYHAQEMTFHTRLFREQYRP